MKVTVYLSDGAELKIEDFDQDSALDLSEAISEDRFATFVMDDSTVMVNVDHIVRIDFD